MVYNSIYVLASEMREKANSILSVSNDENLLNAAAYMLKAYSCLLSYEVCQAKKNANLQAKQG